MKELNKTVGQFNQSIFSSITGLAIKHGAINLAQGFPDFEGPDWILELAQKALVDHKNQYAPSYGLLSLRQNISAQYETYYNLSYRAEDEILVTNGATEAIYCTIGALINPGDEVIVFEPFYDSYLAALQMAQAKIKFVTLKKPDFNFDFNELKNSFSEKTKLVILNSPHNPTGKVFSKSELEEVASLAVAHNCYILSDEVYEFLTYDCAHMPLACLPEMKSRVLTVSSIGKTLSLTGWKIGWVCGPADLIKAIHHLHQFVTFCVAHPLQDAIAKAIPNLSSYIINFKKDYREKRDLLCDQLRQLNWKVYQPKGTYFALAEVPHGFSDLEFCQNLIIDKKVASIPLSSFYAQSDEGKSLIRFCFAKKNQTLVSAVNNLKQ